MSRLNGLSPAGPEAKRTPQIPRVGRRRVLTLAAVPENLYRVLEFVGVSLAKYHFPAHETEQVTLAVEEIFVNIARYAYAPADGMVTINVVVCSKPLSIRIAFRDRGQPFNPLDKADPDITLPFEDRPVGGLGVLIVKQYMDRMTYVYRNGYNRLSITKNADH